MEDPENKKAPSGPANSLKAFRDAGPLLGLGIQMAAAVVVMFFLGRWLDDKWGTAPWMMLVGLLFGAGGGLYNFIHTVNAIDQKKSEKKNRSMS